MRNFILFSTIIGIFCGVVVLHAGVDIKLFYFIILFTFPLLLLGWNFTLPKLYFLIICYVWISGAAEVAFGPDIFSRYIVEAVGITIVSFYYYLFFQQDGHSAVQLFDLYARASFWICLLGIAISLTASIVMHKFVPVKSILREPADFAIVVTPSFYYMFSMDKTYPHRRLYLWTILIAILLSVSSTGMLGLFLCAALLLRGKSWGLVLAPILVGLLFFGTYFGSKHFRLRVNDTVEGASTLDVHGANLSTYALLSNAYVAVRAFQDRPFFGYGVGGHVVAHKKYIDDLPGAETLGDMIDLNAKDANSLLLRTTSEFGLVGLAIMSFFIMKFWTRGRTIYSTISNAIFVYFCMCLLRSGKWFDPEMYFFVWTYVIVFHQASKFEKAKTRTEKPQLGKVAS